jgi:glycosyltransferase involved in cell wall biosynthesis
MSDAMGTGKYGSILMVVGLFHPVVGGAEKVCQRLAKRFIAKGISVTVLTQYCDGLPEYEVIDEIPVYRKMKGWHPFGLAYMFSVLCFFMKHRRRFDIIACFGLFLFIPPAVVMKYLYKKKVVVRLMCSGDFGDFAGIKPLKVNCLITAAAKLCDRIVYISREIKEELEANHFPNEKLMHIPNGVDVNRFAPYGKASGGDVANICFVGRIEKQKGLEHLLRAFSIMRAGDKDMTLSIVGEGQQRDTLEKLAHSLELGDHVFFTGSAHDVLKYYQSALIFVLPSLSEGMSSSLLEAMSCGLPVVVTTVGGNREIVDCGSASDEIPVSQYKIADCGILVNPEDSKGLANALSKLLDDDTLRDQLGERARSHICSRFSQERIVDDYVTLFSQLVS